MRPSSHPTDRVRNACLAVARGVKKMISINGLLHRLAAGQAKKMLQTRAAFGMVFVLVAASFTLDVTADQSNSTVEQGETGLKLPDDLAAQAENAETAAEGPPPKFEIEERRVGGRLERVTVKRANGIDEVYENKEIDSMFSKEENELGEVQNVRRWTLGTW